MAQCMAPLRRPAWSSCLAGLVRQAMAVRSTCPRPAAHPCTSSFRSTARGGRNSSTDDGSVLIGGIFGGVCAHGDHAANHGAEGGLPDQARCVRYPRGRAGVCGCNAMCSHAGERVKSWRRRYFIVKHDTSSLRFEYYKHPGSDMLGTCGELNSCGTGS